MLFPLSTIKKFHAEIIFVAWLRDLSWEVQKYCLPFFFKVTLLESSSTFCYFMCRFFKIANGICICYYFRWISWPFLRAREAFKNLCKLETLNGRVCNVFRGQIFTRNLWPSKDHVLLHETFKKCRVNTVRAPDEFFLVASIEKRQLIYYFH